MSAADLALLAAVILGLGMISRRLERTWISQPMVCLIAGIVLGGAGLGALSIDAQGQALRLIAEGGLALVLFVDASRLDLRSLGGSAWISSRLLTVGLPLTILGGIALALLLLPGLGLAEAAVLAIAVAPTDAALGQPVVTDDRIPEPVREGLNVESGLNDGLCVPLLVVALTAIAGDANMDADPLRLVLEEIGFGLLAGVAVGFLTAVLLRLARAHGWIDPLWQKIIPLAATGLAYGLATMLGGSGLIAAFCAGLVFGAVTPSGTETVEEVQEASSGLLSAVTFIVFGAAIFPTALDSVGSGSIVFALAALTVGRMLPVLIALLGSRATLATIAFAGWFGPRGLASIVFGVIILQSGIPNGGAIIDTVVMTVTLSVVLHGLTARPFADRYVRWLAARSGRETQLEGITP